MGEWFYDQAYEPYEPAPESEQWKCEGCGSLVVDRWAHDEFHSKIYRASRRQSRDH